MLVREGQEVRFLAEGRVIERRFSFEQEPPVRLEDALASRAIVRIVVVGEVLADWVGDRFDDERGGWPGHLLLQRGDWLPLRETLAWQVTELPLGAALPPVTRAEPVGTLGSLVRCRLAMLQEAERRQSPPASSDPWVELPTRRRISAEADWLAARTAARSAQYLTLDILDTCLARLVAFPPDLFRLLAEERGKPEEAELRLLAEKLTKSKYPEYEDAGAQRIEAILATLLEDGEESARSWMAQEAEREVRSIWALPEVLELARERFEAGRPVAYLSDMYWPGSVLRQWLDAAGFPPGEVHTSGDYGLTKCSGGLFTATGFAGKQDWVHIGDDTDGDGVKAREAGAVSFVVDRNAFPMTLWDELEGMPDTGALSLTESVTVGLTRKWKRAAQRDVWEVLGYEVVGPLQMHFLLWILQQAEGSGVENLAFLARDGWGPHQIYEQVKEPWNLSWRSEYVAASRELYGLAAMGEMGAADWDYLLKAAPGLTAREVIERAGIKVEDVREALSHEGFAEVDRPLAGREGWHDYLTQERLYRVFCTTYGKLMEHCRERRERLQAYLQGTVLSQPATAILDVGWRGSLLAWLGQLLPQGESLQGYFLGTWEEAKEVESRGHKVSSMLIQMGQPSSVVQLLREGVALVEGLFPAPHGTISDLRESTTGWELVSRDSASSPESKNGLEQMETARQVFVADFLEQFPQKPKEVGTAYIGRVLTRVLRHPTASEAMVWGMLPHTEGWGVDRAVPLIPTGGDLREGFFNSAWRRGYLATLEDGLRHRLREEVNR